MTWELIAVFLVIAVPVGGAFVLGLYLGNKLFEAIGKERRS